MAGRTLRSETWQAFLEKYWDRRVFHIERLFDTPILEAADLFEVLVAASDWTRSGNRRGRPPFRLYAEGRALGSSPELLPRASDKSLEAHVQRAMATAKADNFMLVCDDLTEYSAKVMERFRGFLEPLYERVGLPISIPTIDAFVGRYSSTAFSIHRDRLSTFSFHVSGAKTFKIWDGGRFHSTTAAMEAYLAGERADRLIERRPGDLVYWPASAWHVGESPEEVSATISFAVQLDNPTETRLHRPVLAQLQQILDRQFAEVGSPDSIPWSRVAAGHEVALPPEYDAVRAAIRDALGSVDACLFRDWLARSSGRGCARPPRDHDVDDLGLDLDAEIELSAPLAWAIPSKDVLIFGSNGRTHLLRGQRTHLVANMLADLYARKRAPLHRLIGTCQMGDPEGVLTLLAVLRKLLSWSGARLLPSDW